MQNKFDNFEIYNSKQRGYDFKEQTKFDLRVCQPQVCAMLYYNLNRLTVVLGC
jgi:hypothetical protein